MEFTPNQEKSFEKTVILRFLFTDLFDFYGDIKHRDQPLGTTLGN